MPNRLKTRKISYEKKKSIAGFLFILPWILGAAYFVIIPVIMSFVYSISKVKVTTNGYVIKLIGFENYSSIFTTDPDFTRKTVSSLQNMMLQVPVVVLLSLFIAIILNQKFFGRTMARVMFFLPVIITSGIVISVISGDVFSQTVMQSSGSSQLMKSDFLNAYLRESGFSDQIVQVITNLVDSIFTLIWKSGIQILIFLAGLQTIQPSMYEAAQVEGSTAWETFWFVTFPMISPIILLNVIYSIVDNFTDYTNQVMVYINQLAINLHIEMSSAMAWSYFAVVMVIVTVIYLLVNKKVFYQK